ncbi:MAG: hypothetical protein D4R43_03835 [Sphingobacteriales bacterium]|nr:MAG: hypothetical protein D4R43_03835 [Sphingobacteriales bacterium]
MKKSLTLLASVALIAVLFSSCKKDWTCTCVLTNSGTQLSSTPTTISNASKADAKTTCDGFNSTVGTLVQTCTIN